MAVPTIYYQLIDQWKKADPTAKKKFSEVCARFRLMVSGSAALPEQILKEWESITGLRLLERYGMTEIGMALSNPYHGERRAGHVGQPLPGVAVRLRKDDGSLARSGEPGEIEVTGKAVFTSYWQRPAATKDAFTIDGWFRTGDIAILEDGYYRILGRNSIDIIKTGGFKVSALEIESCFLQHPGVSACAVVGIPDLQWGEVVSVAVVSGQKDLTAETLRSWITDRMPSYKVPRKYRFIKELPKNAMGKVVKSAVKKYF